MGKLTSPGVVEVRHERCCHPMASETWILNSFRRQRKATVFVGQHVAPKIHLDVTFIRITTGIIELPHLGGGSNNANLLGNVEGFPPRGALFGLVI